MAIAVSLQRTLKVYLQILDVQKHSTGYTTKLLDVPFSINLENFLLPLFNVKRLRGKILSVHKPEITKAHNDNVQLQVRQLEHEADARFSQRQRELFARISQEADQALEDQREKLVTEATSEVWRRDASKYTTYVQN